MKQIRVKLSLLITLPDGVSFPSDAEIAEEMQDCFNEEEVEDIAIEKIEK